MLARLASGCLRYSDYTRQRNTFLSQTSNVAVVAFRAILRAG